MDIYQDIALIEHMSAYSAAPNACVVHVFLAVERRQCVLDYKWPGISASSVGMIDLLRLGLFEGLAIGSSNEARLYENVDDAVAELNLLSSAELGGWALACGDDPVFCAWPSNPWEGLEEIISGFWVIICRLLHLQRGGI